MTAFRLFTAVLLCLLPAMSSAQCRLALALGLDVSGSVDAREYRLQIDGLATALRSEAVQTALFALPAAPVRLMAYEWSGEAYQRRLAGWREISSPTALEAFAAQLTDTARAPAPPATALGTAMQHGIDALQTQPCGALTLDISGDGKANSGPRPEAPRDAATRQGITINALVIGADNLDATDQRFVGIGELSAYFNAYVITGADAFVEVALGFEAYAEAMQRKLLRELEPRYFSNARGIERRHAKAISRDMPHPTWKQITQ